MIRFLCPSCKSILEQPDGKGGEKIACPKCGQRLQVPAPTPNKTILGQPLPDPVAPVHSPSPLPSSVVACPSCNAPLAIPAGQGGMFRCPRCQKPVAVPELIGHAATGPTATPAVPLNAAPGLAEESTAALVCGIISCVMGGVSVVALCPVILFALPRLSGVVLGIIAVALAKAKKARNLGVIGISLSGAAVVLRILLVLILAAAWISPPLFDWLRSGR